MGFQTGVFAFDSPWFQPDQATAAWADIEVDAIGQAMVQLQLLVPEEFNSDAFTWNGDFIIRTDKVSGDIQFIVDFSEIGNWAIGASVHYYRDNDDEAMKLDDALIKTWGADASDADLEDVLRLVLSRLSTVNELGFRLLTEDDIERISHLKMSPPGFQEVLNARGQWDPSL